jgi:glycerophosphoryl diester phosphodiesterase
MLPDLPTLDQLLARYHDRAFLDIELKVPGLEAMVLDHLRTMPPQLGYVVSSFLPVVLGEVRRLNPEIPLGLVVETEAQLSRWQTVATEFLIPHYTLLNVDLLRTLHQAGKKVFVWTVNGRERLLQYRALGVDGIISDDTELLGQLQADI